MIAGDVTFDDNRIDDALGGLAEPVPVRPSMTARIVGAVHSLTSTPRRAAASTLWGVALVVLAVTWLDRPTIAVRTAFGPARASCGIDVFVYGHPDVAVASACRHAGTGRAGLFLASLLLVLAGVVAATFVLAWPRRRSLSTTSPVDAVIAAVGGIAVIVGVFALRPVAIQRLLDRAVVSARCGPDSYFFGHPDPTVRDACHRAYSGHAHIVVGAAIVVTITVVILAARFFVRLDDRRGRIRLIAGAAAAALAVLAALALAPKTVSVEKGAAPVVAACGVDTFLAGHPDHAVQSACRSAFAWHAALGLGAVGVSAVLLVVAMVGVSPAVRTEQQ